MHTNFIPLLLLFAFIAPATLFIAQTAQEEHISQEERESETEHDQEQKSTSDQEPEERQGQATTPERGTIEAPPGQETSITVPEQIIKESDISSEGSGITLPGQSADQTSINLEKITNQELTKLINTTELQISKTTDIATQAQLTRTLVQLNMVALERIRTENITHYQAFVTGREVPTESPLGISNALSINNEQLRRLLSFYSPGEPFTKSLIENLDIRIDGKQVTNLYESLGFAQEIIPTYEQLQQVLQTRLTRIEQQLREAPELQDILLAQQYNLLRIQNNFNDPLIKSLYDATITAQKTGADTITALNNLVFTSTELVERIHELTTLEQKINAIADNPAVHQILRSQESPQVLSFQTSWFEKNIVQPLITFLKKLLRIKPKTPVTQLLSSAQTTARDVATGTQNFSTQITDLGKTPIPSSRLTLTGTPSSWVHLDIADIALIIAKNSIPDFPFNPESPVSPAVTDTINQHEWDKPFGDPLSLIQREIAPLPALTNQILADYAGVNSIIRQTQDHLTMLDQALNGGMFGLNQRILIEKYQERGLYEQLKDTYIDPFFTKQNIPLSQASKIFDTNKTVANSLKSTLKLASLDTLTDFLNAIDTTSQNYSTESWLTFAQKITGIIAEDPALPLAARELGRALTDPIYRDTLRTYITNPQEINKLALSSQDAQNTRIVTNNLLNQKVVLEQNNYTLATVQEQLQERLIALRNLPVRARSHEFSQTEQAKRRAAITNTTTELAQLALKSYNQATQVTQEQISTDLATVLLLLDNPDRLEKQQASLSKIIRDNSQLVTEQQTLLGTPQNTTLFTYFTTGKPLAELIKYVKRDLGTDSPKPAYARAYQALDLPDFATIEQVNAAFAKKQQSGTLPPGPSAAREAQGLLGDPLGKTIYDLFLVAVKNPDQQLVFNTLALSSEQRDTLTTQLESLFKLAAAIQAFDNSNQSLIELKDLLTDTQKLFSQNN